MGMGPDVVIMTNKPTDSMFAPTHAESNIKLEYTNEELDFEAEATREA
jgi:hypothetical protein